MLVRMDSVAELGVKGCKCLWSWAGGGWQFRLPCPYYLSRSTKLLWEVTSAATSSCRSCFPEQHGTAMKRHLSLLGGRGSSHSWLHEAAAMGGGSTCRVPPGVLPPASLHWHTPRSPLHGLLLSSPFLMISLAVGCDVILNYRRWEVLMTTFGENNIELYTCWWRDNSCNIIILNRF